MCRWTGKKYQYYSMPHPCRTFHPQVNDFAIAQYYGNQLRYILCLVIKQTIFIELTGQDVTPRASA